MRVLLYEHLTACASRDGGLSSSLATEGWAMLNALCRDGLAIPGLEVHTIAGDLSRFAASIRVHPTETGPQWSDSFARILDEVDAALVIAPEFDRILEELVRRVEQSGKLHLGCSSGAIAATADKLTCARLWADQGIPTPVPVPLRAPGDLLQGPTAAFPLVLKPRDGAGSTGVRLVRTADEWEEAWTGATVEYTGRDWIATPFVAGQAASVACIVHAGGVLALPASSQRLSSDGRFRYEGGRLPLAPGLAARARKLALRTMGALEGLRGYVGVDIVLGERDDGSADWAIELNPRLTTSYLGLQALCEGNLLSAIVSACTGRPLPELSWRTRGVAFSPDGAVVQTAER
jgi:predicted ATP-grasp superfamily ATP-dependent carboligase